MAIVDELISALKSLLFLSKTETLLVHESLHSKTISLAECPRASCRHASQCYSEAEEAIRRARAEGTDPRPL